MPNGKKETVGTRPLKLPGILQTGGDAVDRQEDSLHYVLGLRAVGVGEGAQTTLHAVLDDAVPEHSGAYYSQRGIYRDKSAKVGGWPMRSPNPEAHDDAAAARFYELSRELTGLSAS